MSKIALSGSLLLFVLATSGFAQLTVEPNDAAAATSPDEFKYLGSFECSLCHVELRSLKYRNDNVADFVTLTEYKNWLNNDPHVQAYLSIIPDREHFTQVRAKLLTLVESVGENVAGGKNIPEWEDNSNQRSLNILTSVSGSTAEEISLLFQKMTSQPNLLTQPDATADLSPDLVATVKQCMSCHAGWDNRRNDFDFEVVEYGTGVSCEACHGPSSNWKDEHEKMNWRKKTPQEKSDQYGFVNVRQPIAKSQQCFSCHIGDVDQGRVVTHAMYAAGHPPLPSIEIESYADQIPRHWRYLPEKTAKFTHAAEFKQSMAEDWGLADASELDKDFPRTKNLLVSGVMASVHSVDLLAESAGEYLKLQNNTGELTPKSKLNPWPEFAAFDCAACHHDLKTAGWERGFAGVPGRPPAPYWPRPLSKLGLAWLDAKQPGKFIDEFLASQQQLQRALDRQPFGNPDQLHEAGGKHSGFLMNIAQQIQGTTLTREDAALVLRLLCGDKENSVFTAETETWDFHSARQLGWAIRLVYSELEQPAVVGQIQLSDQFTAPNTDVAGVLGELQEYLMLDLAPTGEITPLQKKFLTTWRDFDRKKFLDLIDRLAEATAISMEKSAD